MSLYSEYLRERTDTHIIENKYGFVTYRYVSEAQVYIIDLYVKLEFRKQGCAALMADIICQEAKGRGCIEMIGTVDVTAKGAKESLAVLFAYGMDLVSCSNNVIVLKKGL